MSRVGLFGQISEINGHLFLSGAGVLKPEKLRQLKITFIVNATTEEPNGYIPGIEYLKIRVDDQPEARLDMYFDTAADRIRSIRDAGGRTLVHCVAGVSRSATLCIVYLIKYERMTLRQAYHHVKSARPIIRPNIGFWQQLVDYERRLRGRNTVQMVPTPKGDMMIPDLYSDELKRHIITHFASPPNHYPTSKRSTSNGGHSSLYSLTPTSLTSGFGKRRGLSAGSSVRPFTTPSSLSNSHYQYSIPVSPSYYHSYRRRATSPGKSSFALSRNYNAASPTPRHSSLAKSRDPLLKNDNLFSSFYQTSQDMMFPAL